MIFPIGWPGGWGSDIAQPFSAFRRPRYLTTDENGIGITTRRGSRALRWSDIEVMRCGETCSLVVLHTPAQVEVNLYGFPPKVRAGLCYLIYRRAHLREDRYDPHLFTRPTPSNGTNDAGVPSLFTQNGLKIPSSA